LYKKTITSLSDSVTKNTTCYLANTAWEVPQGQSIARLKIGTVGLIGDKTITLNLPLPPKELKTFNRVDLTASFIFDTPRSDQDCQGHASDSLTASIYADGTQVDSKKALNTLNQYEIERE
jgi:hypothetical protein